MEDVEAFCIHCNSAIVLPDVDSHDASGAAHGESSSDSQPATNSADMQRSKSTGAVASNQAQLAVAARGHARRVSSDGHHPSGIKRGNAQLNAHHAHTVASKIRRNHSSGKLTSVGAHALANNISNKSRIAALKPLSFTPHHSSSHHQSQAIAAPVSSETSPPAWMALYCSLACKEADEMASMVTYASLADHHSGIPAYKQSAYASTSRYSPSLCSSSASPRRSTFPHSYGSNGSNGIPTSPLANDSEGSEFDWSDQYTSIRRNGSSGRLTHTSNRDSLDSSYFAPRGDHAGHSRARFPRPRRASSRTRGSTDSLASLSEEPLEEAAAAMSIAQTYFSSRQRQSRPPSALNGNLRAMTPIHSAESPSSTSQDSPDAVTKLDRHSTIKAKAKASSARESAFSFSMLRASSADGPRTSKDDCLDSERADPSQGPLLRPDSRASLGQSKSIATLSVSANNAERMVSQEAAQGSRYTEVAEALLRHSRPSASSLAYYSGSPSSAGSGSVRSTGSVTSVPVSSSSKHYGPTPSINSTIPAARSRVPSLTPHAVPFPRPASNIAISSNYGVSPHALGTSPPLSRAARLSASFDAMYGVLQSHGSHHATHRQSVSSTYVAPPASLQRTPSSLLALHAARHDARSEDKRQPHWQQHAHRRSYSTADLLLDGSEASSPPSPKLHTPDYDSGHRNSYIHRGHQPNETMPRNASRKSFNWDHLPAFVPKYAPMDLEKINRSRQASQSGETNDEGDVPTPTQPAAQRKRLFYFPEPEEHP